MQRNTIIGNIAKIMISEDGKWIDVKSVKGAEGGTKVFLNIADHYWSTKEGKQITRFIPFNGYVPQNLTIEVGMLVDVDFIIHSYKDVNGHNKVSNDITHWDVSLRSMNNKSEQPAQATQVQEEVTEQAKAKTKAKA